VGSGSTVTGYGTYKLNLPIEDLELDGFEGPTADQSFEDLGVGISVYAKPGEVVGVNHRVGHREFPRSAEAVFSLSFLDSKLAAINLFFPWDQFGDIDTAWTFALALKQVFSSKYGTHLIFLDTLSAGADYPSDAGVWFKDSEGNQVCIYHENGTVELSYRIKKIDDLSVQLQRHRANLSFSKF
jgi:hypothetical protein